MTKNEMTIANKTARSNGAVGKNALLPRIITGRYSQGSTILDFGAGPKALHTKNLKESGFINVYAYDMGDNFDPDIHLSEGELESANNFDIVMASNVINTLSSLSAIKETIKDIYRYTDSKGVAIINFPVSPRKLKGLTKDKIIDLLLLAGFVSVCSENHNGTRVFYCYKDREEADEPMICSICYNSHDDCTCLKNGIR